ncbi:OXIDATIVE STRESS 3-like protein [Drosera capensis]
MIIPFNSIHVYIEMHQQALAPQAYTIPLEHTYKFSSISSILSPTYFCRVLIGRNYMGQESRCQEQKFHGQSLNQGDLIKMVIMDKICDHGYCDNVYNHIHDDDDGVRCVGDVVMIDGESASSSSLNGSASSKDSSEDSDDASSSSASSRSTGEDIYDLSELMAELPIKRGLSKFYQGKSESFTSLARVTSLEDLAKKTSPYKKRLKACKSYGGLSNHRTSPSVLPKHTIAKKSPRASLSLSCLGAKSSFLSSCRPPVSSVQSSF